MLTPEQYNQLKPYRHTIVVARSASGQIVTDLGAIYAQHGRLLNASCGACLSRMIEYFNAVIIDYEHSQGTENAG